jgi:hypothetical protein
MNPGELSEQLMYQSAEYSKYTEELTDVLRNKSVVWMEMRKRSTSDKQTDREWDSTVEGMMEMSHRLRLKALEKSMSAIRTRLRILEGEARNMY